MTIYLKTILILILIQIPNLVSARVGSGDWSAKTPGGNEINNFKGLDLVLQSGKEIQNLSKWYFYKNHIIAVVDDGSNEKGVIVNETVERVDTFVTVQELNLFVNSHELKPKVWTRWYSENWELFGGGFILFGWMIWIPILLVYLFVIRKALKSSEQNSLISYPILAVLLTLILVSILVMDMYPESV